VVEPVGANSFIFLFLKGRLKLRKLALAPVFAAGEKAEEFARFLLLLFQRARAIDLTVALMQSGDSSVYRDDTPGG
jgi:hypothetical protein